MGPLRKRLMERRNERDEMIASLQERDQDVHAFISRHPLIAAKVINRIEARVGDTIEVAAPSDPEAFKHKHVPAIKDDILTGFVLEAVLAVVLQKIIAAIIDYVLERFHG